MSNKNELSTEAQSMKDIYWTAIGRGGNCSAMWQEMVDTTLKAQYSKLRGMEDALVAMNERDVELLATIVEMLEANNHEVDKSITWFYKERAKLLKNKSKLKLKMDTEQKRLLESR